MSVRRQEAGGRRQEEEKFFLPKKKLANFSYQRIQLQIYDA